MSPNALIRTARREAGLTQAQLAERMGVRQPVVARLEREGSDLRVSTLARALRAAGRGLYISTQPDALVDEAQIAAHLRLTPAQRLLGFERSYRAAQGLSRDATR